MDKLKRVVYDIRYRTIFISVFVIGLFVHGSRFFTVYLSHDDLYNLAAPGTTFTSGRWLLQYLYNLEVKVMGSHINAKAYLAVATFALLALICCVMARDLQLRSKKSLILLSAIVVTFPYVTTLFGYSFTAAYYCLANLMAIVAASLIQRLRPFGQFWWRLGLCAVLLGLSVAVYQSTLCVFIAYLMVLSIQQTLCSEKESWKHFFLRCGTYLVGCAAGYLFYAVTNKVVLAIKGLSMSSYQGLNEMGSFTLSQMVDRLVLAYKEFFIPSLKAYHSFYNVASARTFYMALVLAVFVLCVVFLVQAATKRSWAKAIQLFLLFALTPAAINSVFLIVDPETTVIYSLMMFGMVFTPICALSALEHVGWGSGISHKVYSQLSRLGCSVVALLLVYTCVYFGYLANVCYTKTAIQQEQTTSYFTRLITRIQSVEGYSTSLPVAYMDGQGKDNEQLQLHDFDTITILKPYHYTDKINLYNWQQYMRVWCGYAPATVSQEELDRISSTSKVQEMPCYPDDGSIQIIDGVIVVKFAD